MSTTLIPKLRIVRSTRAKWWTVTCPLCAAVVAGHPRHDGSVSQAITHAKKWHGITI